MRILVAGAGAVGGYLAARMLEAGADVTLLVRENRRRQLQHTGLVVVSPLGDYTGHPRLITAGEPGGPYDLIVVAMKAYGLQEALRQLAPYAGPDTALLPFLNGFRHMEEIAAALPGRPLLGGVARIEATLDADGRIIHQTPFAQFSFGEFAGLSDELYCALLAELAGLLPLREHPEIVRDLWEKYLMISVLAGLTTLFDSSVGEIRDVPDGMVWFERALSEAADTIRLSGGRLADDVVERQLRTIAALSYDSTSSMLRDMRQGGPTEAAHIHGYLLELARRHGVHATLLETIYQRLLIYENKRRKSL